MGRPTRPRRPLCVRWPRPRAFSPGWGSKGHRTGSERTGRASLHRGLRGWGGLGARQIDFTKPRVRAVRVDRTGESIEQHEPGLALVVGASEPHQCGCASEPVPPGGPACVSAPPDETDVLIGDGLFDSAGAITSAAGGYVRTSRSWNPRKTASVRRNDGRAAPTTHEIVSHAAATPYI